MNQDFAVEKKAICLKKHSCRGFHLKENIPAQAVSEQLKQSFQIEHKLFSKNPNWPEANQLAIYKRD